MSACPCCGAPVSSVAVKALRYIRASKMEVDVITILSDAYPRWVPRSAIADKIYADDPDGGPLYAGISISVRLHRLKGRLADMGWAVKGMRGRGSLGIRLEPLSGVIEA